MGNYLPNDAPPVEDLFDNQTWVKENKTNLFPDDPDRTMQYVLSNHPFHGCAFSISAFPPPHKIPTQNIDILLKYADAVTICCIEVLGYGLNAQMDANSNLTAVGNLAYVVKFHSDPRIRERCQKLITDFLAKN